MSQLNNNTTNLQNILSTVNTLPDAVSVTVDDALSETSTNPVQNKIITEALKNILPSWTTEDEGKVLKIVNGELVFGSIIITFSIEGTEYKAISGMDWGTWCDSDFNTDYWIVMGPDPSDRGDGIGYADTYIVDGEEYVIKEDLIIDGRNYSTLYNNEQ